MNLRNMLVVTLITITSTLTAQPALAAEPPVVCTPETTCQSGPIDTTPDPDDTEEVAALKAELQALRSKYGLVTSRQEYIIDKLWERVELLEHRNELLQARAESVTRYAALNWVAQHTRECKTEDSRNCHWYAGRQGNNVGRSFVNLNGVVYQFGRYIV